MIWIMHNDNDCETFLIGMAGVKPHHFLEDIVAIVFLAPSHRLATNYCFSSARMNHVLPEASKYFGMERHKVKLLSTLSYVGKVQNSWLDPYLERLFCLEFVKFCQFSPRKFGKTHSRTRFVICFQL